MDIAKLSKLFLRAVSSGAPWSHKTRVGFGEWSSELLTLASFQLHETYLINEISRYHEGWFQIAKCRETLDWKNPALTQFRSLLTPITFALKLGYSCSNRSYADITLMIFTTSRSHPRWHTASTISSSLFVLKVEQDKREGPHGVPLHTDKEGTHKGKEHPEVLFYESQTKMTYPTDPADTKF